MIPVNVLMGQEEVNMRKTHESNREEKNNKKNFRCKRKSNVSLILLLYCKNVFKTNTEVQYGLSYKTLYSPNIVRSSRKNVCLRQYVYNNYIN